MAMGMQRTQAGKPSVPIAITYMMKIKPAQPTEVEKPKKCVYCGQDPTKCKDRVDMYAVNEDGTQTLLNKNVMVVWGSGFKISQEFINGK